MYNLSCIAPGRSDYDFDFSARVGQFEKRRHSQVLSPRRFVSVQMEEAMSTSTPFPDVERPVLRFGFVTPPQSEDGRSSARSGCRDRPYSVNSDFSEGVNNGLDTSNSSPTTSTSTASASLFPPSPPRSIIKSRRNRASLTKEADRSRQFTNRLQRSASESAGAGAASSTDASGELLVGKRRGRFRHQDTSSLPADHGLKAIEPPHEQSLTKMAFAEQQKWITVQQKTFTKW